ncbi:MAG: tRNA lysidine(34) synthetase TilS [Prevotellaceae bacterium]|nr:tRNA lysidine(34) synthetase TilS [Prevotellaceae bacterium]
MVHLLISYIRSHRLFASRDRLLVGVSGGVDSMSLLHLLLTAGYHVGVAHCNFGLRGEESDGDERLVLRYCAERRVPYFTTRFSTASHAYSKGISIQMAARELRYEWFEQVADEHGFDKIVVAHNANDEVETFFLNLTRGAGLRGLLGIAAVQGNVVRPLLFAQRSEILDYARDQKVPFREDSSNSDLKYGRNRIRLNVLPELTALNPSFLPTMRSNMAHLGAAQQIINGLTENLRQAACTESDGKLHICIERLPAAHCEFWLFELLHGFGFSEPTVSDIAKALEGTSGKVFCSPTHTLLKDREHLIVSPHEEAPAVELHIGAEGLHGSEVYASGQRLTFRLLDKPPAYSQQGSSVALLDYKSLQFPLTLRTWQAGDSFIPLGMKGAKKLSDFFINSKLNRFEKQHQLLLCSAGGEVAWAVGLRIDNRYRITPKTMQTLMVNLA